ncbi:MAG: transcription elongation factor GreA [Anaerolineales bacterium]|nr:transcription elongation factor GreA [Anaerolineales bacterium]
MEKVIYLTKQGLKDLEEELEHLRTVKRAEVADRLKEAIEDYDMEDSTEFHFAKDEQSFVEGRIRTIENMLARVEVIESGKSNGQVQLGSTVVVKDGRDMETYIIVGTAEANNRERKISDESPLGRALLGHESGDEVEVMAPAGSFKVKIVKVH